MQYSWQKEWFGIKFSDIQALSPKKIADANFYNNFYIEFNKKYKAFNDLPHEWRDQKSQVANDLLVLLNGAEKVLSIGCGCGYIENYLQNQFNKNVVLVATDIAIHNKSWFNSKIKLYEGFFPDCLGESKFDCAYASAIDYCMTDEEYLIFLGKLRKLNISTIIFANLTTGKTTWCFRDHLKEICKSVLSIFGLYNRGQFWGYLRSIEEHVTLFKSAGFESIVVGRHGLIESYWIKATLSAA